MKRRLLNLLTVLSLLLCVAVAGVSAWSLIIAVPFGQVSGTSWDGKGSGHVHRYWLVSDACFHLVRDDIVYVPPIEHRMVQHHRFSAGGVGFLPTDLEPTRLGFARFARTSSFQEPRDNVVRRVTHAQSQWSFPLWLPAIVLAAPAAVRVVAVLRRQRRRRGGLCPACGYDLRATPDRCPECGGVAGRAAG